MRTGGRRGSSKFASPTTVRAVENEAAADPADPTKTGTAAETAAVVTRQRQRHAVRTTVARAEAAAVMTTVDHDKHGGKHGGGDGDGDKHGGGGGGGWDKHGGGQSKPPPATHKHDREDNSRGYSVVSSRGYSRGSGSRGSGGKSKGGKKSQKGHGRRSGEEKRAWWDGKAAEEEEVFGPFGQIPAFKVSELERNRKGRVTCPVCAVQVHPDGLGLHLLHNSGCQSKQQEIETGQKRDRTFTCKKCNKRFWTEWDLDQHAGRCSWAEEPERPRPEVRLRSRSRHPRRSSPARTDRNDNPAADSVEPHTRLRVYADLVELGKNLLR